MSQLIQAIENDDFETAFCLIEENKNNIINIPDSDGNTPLHLTTNFSLYRPLSPTLKQMLNSMTHALIDKGADISIKDKFGCLPIHYVSVQGNLELLKKLIQHGSDYNEGDSANETPIHQAIRRKHDSIIDYLLSIPSLAFKNTVEGLSPLHYAKRYYNQIVPKIVSKFH